MAGIPPSKDEPVPAPKPVGAPKAEGNPAFRALGLPRISKWRLPSRNWLIFLGITGSWTAALLYDRYHKRRTQRKWCEFVSHLAKEPLPNSTMPRKITILLAAPPGDGLRPAREHFHEYIKPVLVAGAIDWEVIEGRREGEVRAGLAEKIRKLRKRSGEKAAGGSEEGDGEEEEADLVWETREKLGISDWNGIQGDLVLGRHTWKEYIRGLHEGWIGPLIPPPSPPPEPSEKPLEARAESSMDSTPNSTQDIESPQAEPPIDASQNPEAKKPATKPAKPSFTPPYISIQSYMTAPTPKTFPESLPPSLPVQLPHLLGLKHTPTRLYRFLTRRHLAEETGAQVAALVLAQHSRPYSSTTSYASATDPDSPPPIPTTAEGNTVTTNESWEQQRFLSDEEVGWHKSVWKKDEEDTNKEGEVQVKKERVWTEPIIIDPRIGSRMRVFELAEGARLRAEEQAAEMEKRRPGLIEGARGYLEYFGWDWGGGGGKKGWEMGLEGDEFS